MILNLEAYPVARTFLSVPPFNQEYNQDSRRMDLEFIESAVDRLKQNRLRLAYEPLHERQ
jgi:hypothetical protein